MCPLVSMSKYTDCKNKTVEIGDEVLMKSFSSNMICYIRSTVFVTMCKCHLHWMHDYVHNELMIYIYSCQ